MARVQTFVVRCAGYYGFGKTLEAAREEFFRVGGTQRDLDRADKKGSLYVSHKVNCRIDHDEGVEVVISADDGGLHVKVNGHYSEQMTEEEGKLARTTRYEYLKDGEWSPVV